MIPSILKRRSLTILLIFIASVASAQQSHFRLIDCNRDSINRLLKDHVITFAQEREIGLFLVEFKNIPSSVAPRSSDNKWKLSSSLNRNSGLINVVIKDWNSFLNDTKITVLSSKVIGFFEESKVVVLELAYPSEIENISKLNSVLFIDSPKTYPKEESLLSNHDLTVNDIHRLNGTGDGLAVSIKEKKPDTSDIDLKNRFIPSSLQAAEISQHANQIATIIAGGGNTSLKSAGVARKAKFSSSNFNNILPDNSKSLSDLGVSTQNHSYGTAIENIYGIEARAYDLQIAENKNLIHVFSIGNSGTLQGTDAYKGINSFATATGNFKMAKNVIVAGAHDKEFLINPRNSRGPAYDGRVIPHVVAYGPDGTSDAAAMVSGLTLLLQEEYKKMKGILPSAALVKSTLIGSAVDLSDTGISFISGYGAINGKRAIDILQNNRFIEESLPANGTKTFNISIPANIRKCRFAISWIDPAAEAGSAAALVHDLNMEIIGPDGVTRWKPWVLSSYPHPDSLQSKPKRKTDKINNTELITIENPLPGTYTIKVSSGVLTTASQDFAIAYQMDAADFFDWVYPNQNAVSIADSSVYLRWFSGHTGMGLLEVSQNGGAWTVVSTLDLKAKYYKWKPQTGIQIAKFKMTFNGNSIESENITISSVPEIFVVYNCTDNVMLAWKKIEGAIGYKIYTMGDRYLEVIQTVSDTTYSFNKSSIKNKYLAVEPLSHTGNAGYRSPSYRYDLQGVNCYYKSLFAFLNRPNVNLTLELSTTANIKEVIFQVQTNEGFSDIAHLPVKNSTLIQFTDPQENRGIIHYRAKIILSDGQAIETETVDVFFADEFTYQLFPNPVRRGESITIFTDGENIEIEFYDTTGKTLERSKVVGSLFKPGININLPTGFYYYRLYRDGKPRAHGKLMIHE